VRISAAARGSPRAGWTAFVHERIVRRLAAFVFLPHERGASANNNDNDNDNNNGDHFAKAEHLLFIAQRRQQRPTTTTTIDECRARGGPREGLCWPDEFRPARRWPVRKRRPI
jgi:hypothetical protein